MAEYIEREATIKRIEVVYCADCNSYNGVRCRACGTGDAIDMIEDAPAADVAPVVHGRWVSNGIPDSILSGCSACGFSCGASSFRYCPNCGARMNGRDDHAVD